jgi:hypothetical protein
VHAARDRYLAVLVEAIDADHRQRIEELEARLRDSIGGLLGGEIGKEYAAKVRADLERSLAETRARFDLRDE